MVVNSAARKRVKNEPCIVNSAKIWYSEAGAKTVMRPYLLALLLLGGKLTEVYNFRAEAFYRC